MAGKRPSRIPVFPLPTTVLFPGIPLPLHVFEPRYRAMVHDALTGSKVIGMVLLKPGWENDYERRPPIYPVGCSGSISTCERLDDGRFNIMLLGERRFRVLGEEREAPYRIANVEYLDENVIENEETARLRVRVMGLVQAVAKAYGATDGSLHEAPPTGITDHEFVNFLSHILALSPIEKQALLEESGTVGRYTKLIDILDFWRLGLERGTGPRQ